MNRFRRHATIFLLALAAACGNEKSPPSQPTPGLDDITGAGIEVATDQGSYQEGASVVLTLQNLEPVAMAYNACTRGLEVRGGNTWTPGPESLRLCSREIYYVASGATRQDSTNLDLGLPAGEYRLVIAFAADEVDGGNQIRAASNSFTIDP